MIRQAQNRRADRTEAAGQASQPILPRRTCSGIHPFALPPDQHRAGPVHHGQIGFGAAAIKAKDQIGHATSAIVTVQPISAKRARQSIDSRLSVTIRICGVRVATL